MFYRCPTTITKTMIPGETQCSRVEFFSVVPFSSSNKCSECGHFLFQFSTSFFSAFSYLYFGYLTRAMRVVYWLQEVLSCFGFCPPQLRNRGRSQGRRKVWKSGGGGASINLGDIICPHSWLVNWFAQNWDVCTPLPPAFLIKRRH